MAQAISKTVLGTLVAVAVVNTTAQVTAAQGFTGDFAPEQWTLFNSSPAFPNIDNAALTIDGVPLAPFNGSLEFEAPESLTLLGSNQAGILDELPYGEGQDPFTCGTVPSGFLFLCRDSFTYAYVTVPESGEIFFDWEYVTEDLGGADFDLFGYVISDLPPEELPDSEFQQVSDANGADRQSGSTRVSVEMDDFFGFSIGTGDNQGGRALVTISNFGLRVNEPDIEVPTSVPEPASGLAIAALAGLGWSRRSRSTK